VYYCSFSLHVIDEGSWGIVAVHCLLHLAAGADIDKFASTKEPFWLS